MARIEGNSPDIRVAENNEVRVNQNGNNQQVRVDNNSPAGVEPQALRTQGEYTRFQLENRYTATVAANNGTAGRTPKAEEALQTVRTALDDSGFLDDVTHTELRRVEDTLRGLNQDEVNYVLSQMSPEEFRQWGEDLNDGGWFDYRGYDENEQNNLFNFLAQNANADNLVKVFEGLGTNVDSVMRLMDSVGQSAPPAVKDAFLQKVVNHPNMESIRNEMLLDLAQMGLDVAGIFDPSGVVDGGNALGYLLRGKIGDAVLTGVGIVPLLGDLAKAGKLGKFGRMLSNIVDMAKHSPQFAKAAEAVLRKLDDVLKNIPLDSLPKPVRDFVESTRKKIDEFFAGRSGGTSPTPPNLPTPPPTRVTAPGGKSADDLKGYRTDADVPAHYTSDPRFGSLAADPDHAGKVSSASRAEAMAGLEAEHLKLVDGPISRGPKGIEFYDANGRPWDVKAPPSPPAGARWSFDAEKSGTSILDELRNKGQFPNKNTGVPEDRRVILDSTYMNAADHKALWEWLNKNLTPDELSRIVEVNTRP